MSLSCRISIVSASQTISVFESACINTTRYLLDRFCCAVYKNIIMKLKLSEILITVYWYVFKRFTTTSHEL